MADDGYDEDFDEEEVWEVMMTETKEVTTIAPKAKRPNHHKDSSSSSSSSSTATGTGSGSSRRIISSGARMIPIRSSIASSGAISGRRSAALSIPEWSTIHKHGKGQGSESHENEDDEDDDVRAPPHEWLAKKIARSQISSSSVFEGAGRTLKGRDLSKVRNAVLIRTGFLE